MCVCVYIYILYIYSGSNTYLIPCWFCRFAHLLKMYLWLQLYTVPFFVSGQTYKISKGSNHYFFKKLKNIESNKYLIKCSLSVCACMSGKWREISGKHVRPFRDLHWQRFIAFLSSCWIGSLFLEDCYLVEEETWRLKQHWTQITSKQKDWSACNHTSTIHKNACRVWHNFIFFIFLSLP